MSDAPSILIVDDHPEMVRVLEDTLRDRGYRTVLATSGQQAIARLKDGLFDAVITDLRMGAVDGLDVVAAAREQDALLPVVVMTAFGGVEGAVEAMKSGAWHYVTKPFRLDEVVLIIERALETRRLRTENESLRLTSAGILGASAAMKALERALSKVALTNAPVLIRGESGTGKELVARAVHARSPRARKPFVAINCSALPEALLESELFGHVKGAFTGATSNRRGLFVEADGGTLFLDELGDMPLPLQAKLLRVLETGDIRAVGADASKQVDVRVVAATHRDLETLAKQGSFRQDLMFRLNVLLLRVPALRDRSEDVPLLATEFLRRARERSPFSPVHRFTDEALSVLATLPFPGNVRELENLVERLVILGSDAEIDASDVRQHSQHSDSAEDPITGARKTLPTLRQLEADYIRFVVDQCGGNKTRAAHVLGIDVSTIHRRGRWAGEPDQGG